ncbi:Pollux isoform A [Gracilaria domingensis]|nr:Pollux isoform A [Gracilaria domingensis]
MFRTVLPCKDATPAKTHCYLPGMCYLNYTDTTSLSATQAEYAALARSILEYGRKTHQMTQPLWYTQALAEQAAVALNALQSTTGVCADHEPRQSGYHPTANDAPPASRQQERYATHGCNVGGHAQTEYSVTSQNESVNGATEDSSPLFDDKDDDEDDESMSSLDSTDRRKRHILRDLQQLLKRGRSAPTRQVVARCSTQCDADDAVSESGVFALHEYSNVCEPEGADEDEGRRFKLYRDERDREALVKELFEQEDEEAVIQRIFFSGRRAAPTGPNEGSGGR